MRLLPREEKFFDQFRAQSLLIVEASSTLTQACKAGLAAMPAAAEKIDELERKGDQIIVDIFRRLNQTFITPLDPEDIHQLGSHLDDIIDIIENIVHCLDAYEIDPIPESVITLCDLIQGCTKAVEGAMDALSKDEAILEFCRTIDHLEEEADLVHRKAVANLFKQEKDPIRVIKLKEILDLLEVATDACEDVSDVLQTVVVKNS